MRSDAVTRRKVILYTARELFAEHGPNFPMESIALASEVGVGTLYRHFNTRNVLVEELTLDMLADVKLAAEKAVKGLEKEDSRAWDKFLKTLLSMKLGALSEALGAGLPKGLDGRIRSSRRKTIWMVNRAVGLARKQGLVRRDMTGNELITGIGIITRPLPRAFRKTAPGLDRRLTSIMLDGMKPKPEAS